MCSKETREEGRKETPVIYILRAQINDPLRLPVITGEVGASLSWLGRHLVYRGRKMCL
jgi:hypothetical protein